MLNISNIHTGGRTIILCALILLIALNVSAQSSTPVSALPRIQPLPTPQAKASLSLESRFFANILRDERAIWTSPFHIGRGDAKWVAPLGLSTALFLATDRRSAGEMAEDGDNQTRLRINRGISRAGDFYTTGGIAATFYLIGRTTKNARVRETALKRAPGTVESK
jgi:hypothetical protein